MKKRVLIFALLMLASFSFFLTKPFSFFLKDSRVFSLTVTARKEEDKNTNNVSLESQFRDVFLKQFTDEKEIEVASFYKKSGGNNKELTVNVDFRFASKSDEERDGIIRKIIGNTRRNGKLFFFAEDNGKKDLL